MAPELDTANWDLYLAALASAQSNAPSLQPVMLWLGAHKQHSLWRTWLSEQGVLIIEHELSFQAMAEEAQARGWVHSVWLASRNTYAVIDVPLIAKMLRRAFDAEEFELRYLLWTEVPVYFLNSVDSCSFGTPKVLALGPEAFPSGQPTSSAVVYLNIDAMAQQQHGLIDTAVKHKWNTVAGIQDLLLEHFHDQLEYLGETLNYKPYWGVRDDAKILFFHGFKPTDSCWKCFVTYRNLTVLGDGFQGCKCNPSFEGLFTMSMANDQGRLYVQLNTSWHAAVDRSRAHYQTWQEVYYAAHSHMNYLRTRALCQNTWKARRAPVPVPTNLTV